MSAVVPPGATSGIRSRGTLRAQKEPAENSTGWIAARTCGRGSVARGGRGFTLIEFIITVAIMGIIAALAAPSFNRMMKEFRLNSTTDQLYTEILRARSEAIKRGSTVIMCRSANAKACVGGPKDWSKGWLVYGNKPTVSGTAEYDASQHVLLAEIDPGYEEYGVKILSNEFNSNPGETFGLLLAFDGDGTLNIANAPVFFTVCDDRGTSRGKAVAV